MNSNKTLVSDNKQEFWGLALWWEMSKAGMSNSNHCAGRTLSFKARKAYSGPQFGKTCNSVSILNILSQIYLKIDKKLGIFYYLFTV